MFHFIFKKSIIVISLFLLSISFSQAQEKTLDDIVSDIKRGSDIEKLEASKLIVPFGLEGKRAVRSLRKLVGKEKDPKNAAVYLSALLAITDDHSRAYKAFTKNGKSQKGKKYEKVRKTTAFFRALGDVSPVPDSLLPYINSLRDDKKVSYVAVNGALAGLVNNNPNMLVKIMDRLDTDPLNTIRILRNVELGLDPYFSKVIQSPILTMSLIETCILATKPKIVSLKIKIITAEIVPKAVKNFQISISVITVIARKIPVNQANIINT